MGTSIVTNGSISSISGYEVDAEARIGSNGWSSGDPEYSVGISSSNFSSGRRVWEASPVETIDSGQVEVVLAANPGGGSQAVGWTVSGGDTVPLYCNNASYQIISSLKVRAAVQLNWAVMSFSDLVFRFYKNGSLQETITYEKVIANTEDTSDEVQEQILTVTPTASDNDKVVVEGNIRLAMYGVDIPDPNAVFGQIFIFSN
jgi:hypothetical protein